MATDGKGLDRFHAGRAVAVIAGTEDGKGLDLFHAGRAVALIAPAASAGTPGALAVDVATASAAGGTVTLDAASTLTVTAASAPAAGGAVTLDAASSLTVAAAAASAAGGTVTLDAASTLTIAAASAPAAGGAVVLFGGAATSLAVTPADASASGGAVTLDAASLLTVAAASAPAAGGTVALTGAVASSMTVTPASAPAAGGSVTLTGAVAASLAVSPATAPAAGGAVALTGPAAAANVLAILKPGAARSSLSGVLTPSDINGSLTVVDGAEEDSAWVVSPGDNLNYDQTDVDASDTMGSMALWCRFVSDAGFQSPVALGDYNSSDLIWVRQVDGQMIATFRSGANEGTQTDLLLYSTGSEDDWVFVYVEWNGTATRGWTNVNPSFQTGTRPAPGLGLGTKVEVGHIINILELDGNVGPIAIMDGPLTDEQVTDLAARTRRWTLGMGGDNAFANLDPDVTVIFEGDSLTEGYPVARPDTYPEQAASLIEGDGLLITYANVALSGQSADQMRIDGASQIDTRFDAGWPSIATINAGVNDAADDTPAADIVADLWSWHDDRRTAGFLTIATTITPRSDDVGAQVIIDAANVLIRADWEDHADALADFAADARLDDPADTDYYAGDNVHHNAAGHGVKAELILAQVQALLAEDAPTLVVTEATASAAASASFTAAASMAIAPASAPAAGGSVQLSAGAVGVLTVVAATAPAAASASLLGAALFAVIPAPASAASAGTLVGTTTGTLVVIAAGASAAANGDLYGPTLYPDPVRTYAAAGASTAYLAGATSTTYDAGDGE